MCMVDTANSECQFSIPGLIRGLIWGPIWMFNVKPVSQPFYYIVINILVTSSEILWKFRYFKNFEIFWKFWNLMKFFEKLKCLKFLLLIMVFFDFLWWVMHLLAMWPYTFMVTILKIHNCEVNSTLFLSRWINFLLLMVFFDFLQSKSF